MILNWLATSWYWQRERNLRQMFRHPGAYDTFLRLSQLLMKQIDLYQLMHYYQSIKFALADFNFE